MATRVLVVDDSPLTQRLLGDVIDAQPGFSVVGTAANGRAALDAVRVLRPDLVTLDLNMPVLDGLTTLKCLMSLQPVRTVVVSAFATGHDRMTFDCLRYGAVDFVTKPSSVEGGLSPQKQRELGECLRRAATIAPAGLSYLRARAPQAVRGAAPRPAEQAVVLCAGHTGMAKLLQVLAGMDVQPASWTVALLDSAPATIEAFTRYANGYTSAAVVAAPDGALMGGAVGIIGAPPHRMVVTEGASRTLTCYRPPEGAEPAALQRAFLSSVAEAFGPRVSVVLLSGAPAGTLDGLDDIARRGGRILAQDPRNALQPDTLQEALRRHGALRLCRRETGAALAGASGF